MQPPPWGISCNNHNNCVYISIVGNNLIIMESHLYILWLAECLMVLLLVITGNSGNASKLTSGVSTALLIDNQLVSDPKGKEIALSNQFQSVFSREDLSNVSTLEVNTSTQTTYALCFV